MFTIIILIIPCDINQELLQECIHGPCRFNESMYIHSIALKGDSNVQSVCAVEVFGLNWKISDITKSPVRLYSRSRKAVGHSAEEMLLSSRNLIGLPLDVYRVCALDDDNANASMKAS